MGQFSKKWEELNFSDNYIFCKVMREEALCKEMLEILLKIKVDKIEYLETEHSIENFYDSRGIRMDVYLKDSDRVFDLEMQTGEYDDIILRSRYYQSASDVSSTPRRTQFKNLKETFIIFICKDDPFGYEIPIYTKESTFRELNDVSYDDKTHNVFYNSSAFSKAEDEDIRDVLEFIYHLKAKSKFTKKLESSVNIAKQKPIWKDEYMYFQDILEDEKEEARAIGLAEGREEGRATGLAEGRATGLAEGRATGLAEGRTTGLAEGRAEGRAEGSIEKQKEIVKKMLEHKFSIQDISECTGMNVEEIKKLA